jgi:Tol biopolymer transport system component
VPESQEPAPSASATAETSESLLRVRAAGVRMRDEPSASGELLATLPDGATVARTDAAAVEADDLVWYEVRFGETTGWVASGPEGDWLASVTNGRIGFACTACGDAGSRAAATVEPDGSDRQILLSAFGSPTWSPDGTQVVIESEARAFSIERELTLMAADGSDATSLGEGSGAAWSPDGEWLAFSNHPAGTLVVIDPDGRRFDLTVNDHGAPDSLAWSPDSTMLALVAIACDGCPTDEPPMGDVPRAIYLFTPPMGSVDRVVEPGFYGQPIWSPDGSSLTYSATDLSTVYELRRLDIASGTVTTLASGDSLPLEGALSPDGSRLTALTPEGIVVADSAGGDPRVVVPRTDDMNPTPMTPRWSPDGRWILYDMAWVTGDAIDSWIVPADGSGEPQLVSEDASGAAWQPILVPAAD